MDFKEISTRLKIAKKNIKEIEEKKRGSNATSFGKALKISTDLVAAAAVATIIGFILDKTFGTKPWLILIFFFVGVIAGLTNVIKSAKNMQK